MFWDRMISVKGVEVYRAKIEVIKKLSPPISVEGVRSFLGHTDFHKRIIKDFCKISNPFCILLEKEEKFVFDRNWLKVFKCLKEKLVVASIIIDSNWS